MISSTRSAAIRWTLLAALAFALIGMHNLVATGPAHREMAPLAMSGSVEITDGDCCPDHESSGAPAGQANHDHDFLHLCLAVIGYLAGAGLMLLLFVGLARWLGEPRLPALRAVARGPDRPPGNGRTILTSVCVLRL